MQLALGLGVAAIYGVVTVGGSFVLSKIAK